MIDLTQLSPGWKHCRTRDDAIKGKRMVYEVGGIFVISENEVWIPGAYATLKAAETAFDMADSDLQRLQDMANEREPDGTGGVITEADLSSCVRESGE